MEEVEEGMRLGVGCSAESVYIHNEDHNTAFSCKTISRYISIISDCLYWRYIGRISKLLQGNWLRIYIGSFGKKLRKISRCIVVHTVYTCMRRWSCDLHAMYLELKVIEEGGVAD